MESRSKKKLVGNTQKTSQMWIFISLLGITFWEDFFDMIAEKSQRVNFIWIFYSEFQNMAV